MSKKRLLQQKYFYSRNEPGKLTDVQTFLSREPALGFSDVLRHLVDRRYIHQTRDGYCHLLPKGLFIHEAVAASAAIELERAGALRYRFASVFSTNREDGVWSLVSKFEDQMYGIAGKAGQYLKYASDPLLFEYFRGRRLELPHRVYSPDFFFRAIRSGELRPLIQPREFYMTDFHFFCEASDRNAYIDASLMNKRAVERYADSWWLNIDTNVAFVEASKAFILEMLDRLSVDAVVNVTTERTHYYSMQSQFMVDYFRGNTTQLANLQLDEENGRLFDIRSAGSGLPATIIHGTVLGRTEKILALVVGQQMAKDGKPMLPLSLAPIVVRVLPVDHSVEITGFLEEVVRELERVGCRYDVDDRLLPLRIRVRDAERDWIPFQATVDISESTKREVSVRDRFDGTTRCRPLVEFVDGLPEDGRSQLTPKRFRGDGLY